MTRIVLLLALVSSSCVAAPSLLIGEAVPAIVPPPAAIAVRVLSYKGEPLVSAGVEIRSEGADPLSLLTDEAGMVFVEWNALGLSVHTEAAAHKNSNLALTDRPTDTVEIRMAATVLEGFVAGVGGRLLEGATVMAGGQTSMSAADGSFRFIALEPGEISASRAAYLDGTARWTGDGVVQVSLEPRTVRALHVGGPEARGDKWVELLQIAADTEANAFVVDIKDETGTIYFDSQLAIAQEVDSVRAKYEIPALAATMAERDLYLIGRIVAFQDPRAAEVKPSIAVHNSDGSIFIKNGQSFLDPTDPVARQYAIDLAVEACELGFEEIQFDYVRYPDGFGESTLFDGGSSEEVRAEAIRSFLFEASKRLHPLGCAVSADIFGFITTNRGDGGIGQQLEMLAQVTDVLSPMIYPSHYSTGWFGFTNPNDNPGPVIANALDDGLDRILGQVILRPWLQDFSYNAAQVRAQIDSAEERKAGWMLWNSRSSYTIEALNESDSSAAP